MVSRYKVGLTMWALIWGVLHGWSIANPWDGQALWWLQLISIAWLARCLIRIENPKAAFWTGAWFGLGWFASSMWWLYTSMHNYGDLAAPLAVLAVVALSALLASFYAAAAYAFVGLKKDQLIHPFLDALLFAALWLLAELLRATVMTGLPWSASGYAHIDSPLIAAAPWVGVYGLSALAALVAAWFVLTRSCLLKIAIIFVLCIKATTINAPKAAPDKASQPATPASLTVRLLQGNIPQNEKFDMKTGVDSALTWYKAELLKAADEGIDLVVAPETAIPLLPQQLPSDFWPALHDRFNLGGKTAALVGIPLGSLASGYTNSVMGLPGEYRYDKQHLVPFGEFIPPLFRWFTDLLNIPLGDFKQGEEVQKPFMHAGFRLAPNICYEDLFGEELAKRFANAEQAPDVFVNVSNIGWFGNGIAIDQHLNISRMRAIEFARPMIRATNTGATAIIDYRGVVTHSLPRSTRDVLTGEVRTQPMLTPYAQWASEYGLQPLWLLACGLIALAFLRRKSDQ
jgi:apolipoprotein N-acyltransferase